MPGGQGCASLIELTWPVSEKNARVTGRPGFPGVNWPFSLQPLGSSFRFQIGPALQRRDAISHQKAHRGCRASPAPLSSGYYSPWSCRCGAKRAYSWDVCVSPHETPTGPRCPGLIL